MKTQKEMSFGLLKIIQNNEDLSKSRKKKCLPFGKATTMSLPFHFIIHIPDFHCLNNDLN